MREKCLNHVHNRRGDVHQCRLRLGTRSKASPSVPHTKCWDSMSSELAESPWAGARSWMWTLPCCTAPDIQGLTRESPSSASVGSNKEAALPLRKLPLFFEEGGGKGVCSKERRCSEEEREDCWSKERWSGLAVAAAAAAAAAVKGRWEASLISQCHRPPSWEQVKRLFGKEWSNLTSHTAREREIISD